VKASDDELLSRTALGDSGAFAELVARYNKRILALALRIVGARDVAEDIVQETFTRAWINAPLWQPRNRDRPSYSAWLSRIAMNLAIDQTRKIRLVDLGEAEEPKDLVPLPDAALIDRERNLRVRAAIANLPERQRLAVSLTYDAELSNAEAARVMETSVGAFELLLVRARRALRTALSDE
jgi:RNA polymerase sigma-70 factor (ECF subfamily)